MSKALRVVCLEPHGVAYVGCPICLVRRQDARTCWWCEGDEWERASAWDWSKTPAEWVEEVGGSAGDVRRCADLTLVCPSWLDVKTGHKKPDVDVPAEDVVWVDEDVGGFTDQRPVGPLVAEVAQLRAKLKEAEATIEQLRAERPRVVFEWHYCPICQHDTKHTHAQPSQLLASPARCAVCGVAHEVTR